MGLDLAMSNMGYLFFKLATDNLVPFNYNAEGPLDEDDLYFNAAPGLEEPFLQTHRTPKRFS